MTDPARAKHLPVLVDDPEGVAVAALEWEPDSLITEVRAILPAPAESGVLTRTQIHRRDRSRRKRTVRAKTIDTRRIPKGEMRDGRRMYPDEGSERPRTRAECENHDGPCPFVSCQFHLYLDVNPKTGSIKLNMPDIEPDEMAETCALDVADRGGQTLEQVAAIMNLTRERIRQVQDKALLLVRPALVAQLADYESADDEDDSPARVGADVASVIDQEADSLGVRLIGSTWDDGATSLPKGDE